MRHPKDNLPTPPGPYPSERQWSEDATRRLDQQRQSSGNLPLQPAGNPVRNGPPPFKNLRK